MIIMSFTVIGGQGPPIKPPKLEDIPITQGDNRNKRKNFLAILIFFTAIIIITGFTITFGWSGALLMAILIPPVVYGGRKFNEARNRQTDTNQ